MKKVISYSLWGNDKKYINGALRNIDLAKEYFNDWKIRIYVSTNTQFSFVSDNLEIVYRTEKQSYDGSFWRFEACDSDDIVIIRDLDDRLSKRHKFVVDEWLNSNKKIHIIRDHPNHLYPIMAGLWGCRGCVFKGITNKIENWNNKNYYTTDQEFLRHLFNDKFIPEILIHDPYHKTIGIENDIKLDRENYEFLGDTYDENDLRREDYWKVIEEHQRNNIT